MPAKRNAKKPAPQKSSAFKPKPGAVANPQFVLVACWNCEKTDCDLYREAEKFRRTFWLCEKHSSAICPVCGTAANFSGTKSTPKVRSHLRPMRQGKTPEGPLKVEENQTEKRLALE